MCFGGEVVAAQLWMYLSLPSDILCAMKSRIAPVT